MPSSGPGIAALGWSLSLAFFLQVVGIQQHGHPHWMRHIPQLGVAVERVLPASQSAAPIMPGAPLSQLHVASVTIMDASMEDVEGNKKKLPLIFVRGSRIRFVHIPDSVNVCDAVEEMRLLQDKVALGSMSRKGGPPTSNKPGESSISSRAEASIQG